MEIQVPRENNEHFLFGVIIVGEGSPTFSKISESADASEPFLDKDEFDSKDTQKSHERNFAFSLFIIYLFWFSCAQILLWLFLTRGYLMCSRAPLSCAACLVAARKKKRKKKN